MVSNITNQAAKGVDAPQVNDFVYAQLLGEPIFSYKAKSFKFASRKFEQAIIYLSLQCLPVSIKTLAELVDAPSSELTKQLQAFAQASRALEFSNLGKSLRVHFESDVLQFERAVKAQSYLEAIELYKAQCFLSERFLAGASVAFRDWAYVEQVRLQLLYLECLRAHYERLACADHVHQAIRVAKKVISLDPLDETTHQRIMQLELHLGNAQGALRQYSLCKKSLTECLAVEPLEETTELALVALSLKGFEGS